MEQLLDMTLNEGIFACLFVWLLVTVFKQWNEVRLQLTGQVQEQWKCIQKQNDIIEKQTEQIDEQGKKIDNLTIAVRDLSDTVKKIISSMEKS